MTYHLHCLDDPQKPGLRATLRPDHLRYMMKNLDRVPFGGPLLDEDGRTIGSAFALNVDTRAQVDAFLSAEPYFKADLFSKVTIARIRVMAPEPEPGFLQRELERELAKAG